MSMRTILLLAVACLLTSCESTSLRDRLRERFSAAEPQVDTFAGEARDVYFAAQVAFKRLDYNLVRSDLGGLTIEAASRINRSVVFRDSRQLIAFVEIASVGPAQSEVSLRLREQLEGDNLGGPSEIALKEHGFYQTYFAVLKQVLEEQAAAGATGKN